VTERTGRSAASSAGASMRGSVRVLAVTAGKWSLHFVADATIIALKAAGTQIYSGSGSTRPLR
jgi:hypothetical protein